MAAAVETMAYAGTVPWHGLGNKVEGLTPNQMLKAAGLNWTVSKRPLFYARTVGGEMLEIDNAYALARDTDDQFLSIAKERYKIIQNWDGLDFFTEFCAEGGMTMETAGSLQSGKYIWALAKINGGFKVGRGDDVADYVLIFLPHVVGNAAIIKWTGIRVVCWNTLSMALGTNIMGDKTDEFRVSHSIEFSAEVKEQAKLTLRLAKAQSKEFKEAAQFLAKRRASVDAVQRFFGHLLDFDPSVERKTPAGNVRKPPRLMAMFSDALERAPGQELATAEGTWWGALNAVTYVVDHEQGNSRDTGLRSAWLGDGAVMKQKALQSALQMAS